MQKFLDKFFQLNGFNVEIRFLHIVTIIEGYMKFKIFLLITFIIFPSFAETRKNQNIFLENDKKVYASTILGELDKIKDSNALNSNKDKGRLSIVK